MFLKVALVLVSGFFSVGLLPALLSQRGEWEEVPLVPQPPVDVPLHPLLLLPGLVPVPD
jgi:hypothetical protein